MKVKPFLKPYKLITIGLILLFIIMSLSTQDFIDVDGQNLTQNSSVISETNFLTSHIPHINEELLKNTLSPQMRTSLIEKLALLVDYSEISKRENRIVAIKDIDLVKLAPEVNDPLFQQGIFSGGDHLIINKTIYSNNYLQIEYGGYYIQLLAGKNLATLSGSLVLIVTSPDKTSSEVTYISIPGYIHDLIILSFDGNSVKVLDQENQIHSFDIVKRTFTSER